MYKKIMVLLMVCLCSQVLWSANESKTASKILDTNSNLSVEEWHKETLKLAHERFNIIDKLVRQLHYGKNLNKEKKIRICYLLGEYRASSATIDLL
jgi:hypothetical protein